jgi:hypothetical protein
VIDVIAVVGAISSSSITRSIFFSTFARSTSFFAAV